MKRGRLRLLPWVYSEEKSEAVTLNAYSVSYTAALSFVTSWGMPAMVTIILIPQPCGREDELREVRLL